MASIVVFLRYVFLVSGGLFGFVVLADKFGITMPNSLESGLIATTLSVCMLTAPMLLTILFPEARPTDDDSTTE